MINIQKTDDSFQIALQLFEKLELNASVTIYGFEGDEPKGEAVIRSMIELDIAKNCKNGKRRRVRAENQIGDYVAQKAFKWARRIVDNKIRFDIWRIQ